jgi:hypothetical protein
MDLTLAVLKQVLFRRAVSPKKSPLSHVLENILPPVNFPLASIYTYPLRIMKNLYPTYPSFIMKSFGLKDIILATCNRFLTSLTVRSENSDIEESILS